MKKKNFAPIVGFIEFLLLFLSLLSGRHCLFDALAQYRNLSCLNEATNCFCNSNILEMSNGGCDLRPQDHPFVDKHFRFDHFQSFDCGIVHLV